MTTAALLLRLFAPAARELVVMPFHEIMAATRDGRQATDDAQLVEWLGHVVRIVPASGPNPKITRPEDLRLAESLLASGTDEEPAHFGEGARRRTGVGEIGS